MYKITAGIAALALTGAVALPLSASAAEQKAGATPHATQGQSTEFSSQRRYWRGRYYGYGGPRRYYGPRYGYYRGYPYGGYPYGYYGRPYYGGVGVGIGPFGFRVF